MLKPYPITELEKSISHIREICKKYKINPDSLKAYGLVVSGKNRWSANLDLLVEPEEGVALSSWDFEELTDELDGLNLSYKVSVISKKILLDNEENQKIICGTYEEIANEAVPLYEIITLHKHGEAISKNDTAQQDTPTLQIANKY